MCCSSRPGGSNWLTSLCAVTSCTPQIAVPHPPQVNNQPSLLGQVALTCNIIQDAVNKQNRTPLEALATVNTYFNSNGSATWCSEFDPTYYLIDKDLPSYSYQCCTQGTVYSSELPATGSPGTLTAAYAVTQEELRSQCETLFGKGLPDLRPPSFAVDIKTLVLRYQGIVFTNGDADGWSGGSYYSCKELYGPAGVQQSSQHFSDVGSEVTTAAAGNVRPSHSYQPLVAFIDYHGASHCTDTHTFNWGNPADPVDYRHQRARAMDYAAEFMRWGRKSVDLSSPGNA